MVEIIREDAQYGGRMRALPKDIRQIGTPDIGMRIYVERRVYEKLHLQRSDRDKSVYVLLGRCENAAGRKCVFAEDVVMLKETTFIGNLPDWRDETWAYLYRHLTRGQESLVIVGWAIDLKGRMPGLTAQLERMHMDLFGGEHQVLLLMDTLEGEETLYGFRGGRFCKRDGFYIYSNREVRNASVHVLPRAVPDENIQREAPRKNRSAKSGRRRRKRLRSYASSAAMLALALMLCRALYINYQKMNELEAALAVVREDDAVSGIAVEGVAGNIYKMPDTETANETDPVNEDTGTEPAQVDALSGTDPEGIYENAADIYLEQGYYVVQQGDSLAGICRKIYQTTDIMARICEANNIENADSIYVGQQLILPQ